jgi:hypothetical protein
MDLGEIRKEAHRIYLREHEGEVEEIIPNENM